MDINTIQKKKHHYTFENFEYSDDDFGKMMNPESVSGRNSLM